jgi:hypothetical protein
LNKSQTILGEDHPDTLRAMNNLAWTYGEQGRTAETAELQKQVLNQSQTIPGEDHPDTFRAMNNLAFDVR